MSNGPGSGNGWLRFQATSFGGDAAVSTSPTRAAPPAPEAAAIGETVERTKAAIMRDAAQALLAQANVSQMGAVNLLLA